jgi:oxygen-dependent protoporphyrinogen oxidase
MIAIIGAGISGLTLAYELQKQNIDYILLEASGDPGGVINSSLNDGYILEKGPNMLMVDDRLKTFIEELGLEDQIAYPAPAYKKRYIFKDGAYRQLPASPTSFLFSDFFSFKTKIDLFKEFFTKSTSGHSNETLADFFERRFNREIVDYIVDPLISGIYAGNSNDLLVQKTFPFLLKMEENYGSVLKGFLTNKKAPKKDSISFKSGMNTLTNKIASELIGIRYNCNVTSMSRSNQSTVLYCDTDQGKIEIVAEKVVITSPAYTTATMVKESYPVFANALENIQYAPIVKVFTAFEKKHVKHTMDGYGGLNPSCEKQYIMGSIWNSSIYPQSCPENQVLITSMVGGSINPGYTLQDDESIKNRVIAELRKYYTIDSDPVHCSIQRIPHAIPQFNRHILPVDAYATELEKDGIYICANWKDGAAISDCMKKAINMAEKFRTMLVGEVTY